jgi:hypothetical protein
MSDLVLKNKQLNKYFVSSAIAEAKCHFENLNSRRFWEFALEKIRSVEKLTSTQKFYIKDEDFLNNHPMIKSKKNGTEKIMTKIVTTIKKNNFYQAFQSNPLIDTPNIAIVSVITRQKSKGQTFVRLNQDFINFVLRTKSYTSIDKNKLLQCKTNKVYDLFKLLKKWEKAFPKKQKYWNEKDKRGVFKITTQAIRNHLHVSNENLQTNIALTRNLKSKCKQINEYNDIQVIIQIIKINNKTVGYRFEIKPNKPQTTIIQRMMRFKIKGKAVVGLRAQYSDDEIEAGLFILEGYDPNQITSSNFSFLIGVIQNQTGRKYAL